MGDVGNKADRNSTQNEQRTRIERFFYHYGHFVCRHTTILILLPIVLTVLSCYGYRHVHMESDIWQLLSPKDQRGQTEKDAIQQMDVIAGNGQYSVGRSAKICLLQVRVIFTSKQEFHQSMFTKSALDALSEFNQIVESSQQLTDIPRNGSSTYAAYSDLCGFYCYKTNRQLLAVLQILVDNQLDQDSKIEFTYPMAVVREERVYLGMK